MLADRYDTNQLIRVMPSSFDEARKNAEQEWSTSKNIESTGHFLNRIVPFGSECNRVWTVISLVHDPRGLHWFAFIFATSEGAIDAADIPLHEWSAQRQMHACHIREQLLAIEPRFEEVVKSDGYHFTGPIFPATQISES